MPNNKKHFYRVILVLVILTASALGWVQIVSSDEPAYCFEPESFKSGLDCAPADRCGYSAVKQCLLMGGEYVCCPYEAGGWYCSCIAN